MKLHVLRNCVFKNAQASNNSDNSITGDGTSQERLTLLSATHVKSDWEVRHKKNKNRAKMHHHAEW